jgi:hypothetical protein
MKLNELSSRIARTIPSSRYDNSSSVFGTKPYLLTIEVTELKITKNMYEKKTAYPSKGISTNVFLSPRMSIISRTK